MSYVIGVETLTDTLWDAVVLGAGPAGALAARTLALRGKAVLLIDKQQFPRGKVCGCCLNASALRTLSASGLAHLIAELNAISLNELRVFVEGGEARIPLSGNVAISREALDAALVKSAVEAGARFLPDSAAQRMSLGGSCRHIQVRTHGSAVEFRARMVFAATGLDSPILNAEPGMEDVVARNSLIGLGGSIVDAPKFYGRNQVFMACRTGGYAGLVRLEDGRLNLAAALDTAYLREFSSPALAIAVLLESAGLPAIKAIHDTPWHGTALLTRSRKHLSAERLFAIGDAAGYVEPFTGEGMAWGMRSGVIAAQLIPDSLVNWDASLCHKWESIYAQQIKSRQFCCKIVSKLLRRPRLSRVAAGLLETIPSLARMAMRTMNAPMPAY